MIKTFDNKTPDVKRAEFVAENSSLIGQVVLHEASSVWYNAVLRADIASIQLGAGSNIQDGTVCHVDYDKPVIIGKGVTIGHNVTLHGCKIGDDSLIGMGAVILDGAIIGEGSLVGAGAVVTPGTVIPPKSLVLGSPAKVKRELSNEELEHIKNNAKVYVELAKHHKLV
jgi:carbonic anhydrase/acetyltransferase-like protein (isoleucine patch superfamily)